MNNLQLLTAAKDFIQVSKKVSGEYSLFITKEDRIEDCILTFDECKMLSIFFERIIMPERT